MIAIKAVGPYRRIATLSGADDLRGGGRPDWLPVAPSIGESQVQKPLAIVEVDRHDAGAAVILVTLPVLI